MSDTSGQIGRSRRTGRLKTTLLGVLAALVVLVLGFVVWTQIVMPGTRSAALEVWEDPAVSVTDVGDAIVLAPTGDAAVEASGTGLVFIPGAKVDPYAYLRKLSGVVEEAGATVVITKPTLNLAFFDQRSLETFTAAAPDVDTWFVGGHSLGGVRACQLAEDPAVAGLVLFGSYCANDLSEASLAVLSLSGSDDGLSTPEKVADARVRLPADATMVEIDGANHASFGDYGVQPGDGEATISSDTARAAITRELVRLLG
ncbi:alpha/beta hydrolase [Plantibacter sp. Leaf314]|uniref:alpha/beta hydrolase n=1 Tax=Plantibacter sp. Leaf314 TaxID=1736333 RepID=UPI000B2D6E8D|nr:alpha/beta hydrolase [Plantibacter sp. Leaf314]